MKTATSTVSYEDTLANELLRDQCKLVSDNGGSYSITTEYKPCWMNTYVINWSIDNRSKPHCKECKTWLKQEADNKEWMEAVVRGRKICEQIVASKIHK